MSLKPPFNAAANDNGIPTLDRQFLRAAEAGDVKKMKELRKQGANIDAREFNNDTPLIVAARENKYDAVKYLLDLKADIAAVNDRNQTALSVSTRLLTQEDEMETAEKISLLLLRHKSPVDNVAHSFAPVHSAIMAHNVTVFDAIMAAGANPRIKGPNDATPMIWAVNLNSEEIIERLKGYDFGLEDTDKDKRTVLMAAAAGGDAPRVADFIALGANVLARDRNGDTARMIGLRTAPEVVKLLAAAEAKLYRPLADGHGILDAPASASFTKKTKFEF